MTANISNDLKIVSENRSKFIIGFDEVGRGAGAGPLCVGAVAISYADFTYQNLPIRDSKKLSEEQRRCISLFVDEHPQCLMFERRIFTPSHVIDEIGIEESIRQSMQAILINIKVAFSLEYEDILILTDGKRPFKIEQSVKQIVRVGADDTFVCVALASILAKYKRDLFMNNLALSYPEYEWQSNKGYLLKAHKEAIREHGLTKYHRKTFCT